MDGDDQVAVDLVEGVHTGRGITQWAPPSAWPIITL